MIYKKKWPLIIFLLPSLIFLIVFLYIPFFNNIKNSLFDMTTPVLLDGQVWKFIGIDNYRRMLTDPDLRIAIWNSLKMMFLTIIFQVGIAFILAVLVSNIRKMQQFFRTVYFFAVVISVDVSLFCCVVITAVSVVVSSAAQIDMEDDAIIRDNITTKNLFSVL